MKNTMTEKERHYVESSALRAVLQSSGNPINIQRNLAKWPKTLLGLNNGSLFVTQGKKHLYDIIIESRADYITVHHIRDEIESRKIELGLPKCLFSNCLTPLEKFLNTTCITHTWQLMDKYDILVEEMKPNLFLQRLNCSFLMKNFLKAGYER